MASILVRGLKKEAVEALKFMAASKGKRGIETYVREVLETHALPSNQEFLDDIDACHNLIWKKYNGPLLTKSEDLIREDRDV